MRAISTKIMVMKAPVKFLCLLLVGFVPAQAHAGSGDQLDYQGRIFPLYPIILNDKPNIPSPFAAANGDEYVVAITKDSNYTIIPVTVENGAELNYKKDIWYAKGRQRDVDSSDFPALAATGLHSETELDRTRTITGRPVDEVTRIARPDQSSRIGFIASDEDIMSVLKGDNRLVRRLGLTHPELAKPLFHVFNVIVAGCIDSKRGNIKSILYNGREVFLRFWGSKGWQESIFNDEILGYWEIEVWRELDPDERALLSRHYSDLSEEAFSRMIRQLSYIHTGEMVPFYIMRYGFYEGHTGYRADPIAIASIFGLITIEEIVDTFDEELDSALARHHLPANSLERPEDEGE